MAKDIYIGEILSNEEIQKEYFLMKVKLASSFDDPLPGQFVMIRIAGLNDPFLSRPVSIYSFPAGIIHAQLNCSIVLSAKGRKFWRD